MEGILLDLHGLLDGGKGDVQVDGVVVCQAAQERVATGMMRHQRALLG